MIEVDAVFAAFSDGLLTEALAELPRLVAADVHLMASEIREVAVEQRAREVDRSLVWAQCAGEFLELSGERVNPAFGAFGHRAVARVAQPALHMPEGVEVRDELDADRRARIVELTDLRGRQRRSILPDVFVPREGERVFDVELQLVDAQAAERANEGEELSLRGHARARNVEHEAAYGEVG